MHCPICTQHESDKEGGKLQSLLSTVLTQPSQPSQPPSLRETVAAEHCYNFHRFGGTPDRTGEKSTSRCPPPTTMVKKNLRSRIF